MDKIEFKKIFGKIARACGFRFAFGGWYKESDECIITLNLQKSDYRNSYYLNVKIYIQDAFGNKHKISKYLIKNDIGDIFLRQPPPFDDSLDFENSMDDELRERVFWYLFEAFISPLAEKSLSRVGLRELAENQEIYLYPAVKEELGAP